MIGNESVTCTVKKHLIFFYFSETYEERFKNEYSESIDFILTN